jgi:hypothetical protein
MRRRAIVIVAAFLALGTVRLAAQNWSSQGSLSTSVASLTGLATGMMGYLTGGAGHAPGQTSATPAVAGAVGELFQETINFNLSTTASVSSASPAVITWTGQPFSANCISVGPKCVFPVFFANTTGAAGITALQNYFIDPASLTANTFRIATTVANALAGVDVNTTSTGTGLLVAAAYFPTSATIQTVAGFQLTPGDWDCSGNAVNAAVAAQSLSLFSASFAGTPASLSTLDGSTQQTNATQAANTSTAIVLGPRSLPTSTAIPLYFNAELAWTGGASGPSVGGTFRCRRMQ